MTETNYQRLRAKLAKSSKLMKRFNAVQDTFKKIERNSKVSLGSL